MNNRVSELEDTVNELAEEVRYLRGEVSRLRREVSGGGHRRSVDRSEEDSRSVLSQGGRSAGDRSGYSGSQTSYSLVGHVSEAAPPSPAPVRSSCSSVTTEGGLTWSEREDICRGIGQFVTKALGGRFHGASGRDQINLPSRIWLLFRDYEGVVYSPVRVFRQFAGCRHLVKRGGSDLGTSVFVGLPSEREARVVVASAGCIWPNTIQ